MSSYDGNLYALNASGGSLRWYFSTNSPMIGSPAIGSNRTIYFGSGNANFYALDPQIGGLRWQYSLGGAIESTPAFGTDGAIYVGTSDYNLYSLTDNYGSCATNWTFPTSNWITSSPVVGADGTIYLGSADGSLYALNDNGASCTLEWQYSTGNSIYSSSPAIGADGTLYCGSSDEHLYAISGPPTITSFTPSSGDVGTMVTITGVNFSNASAVDFGNSAAAAFTVISDTTIRATVGSGGSGAITVTTPAGTTASSRDFTFAPPLTAVTLTTTPASPATLGATITLYRRGDRRDECAVPVLGL